MNIKLEQIIPERDVVFESMGVSPASNNSRKLKGILDESLQLFVSLADPVGLTAEIRQDQFAEIYEGEGENDEDNVLKHIYPQAENFELFALTLGAEISSKIEDLFDENDYPLGYMLDTIASIAADKASTILEDVCLEGLKKKNQANGDTRVLSYSPGYCGWHISGQKKLFDYLQPGKIGISLNASYLMTPLKSVSGVLVAGNKEIHQFRPKFSFCKSCKTHTCLLRMKDLSKG